MNNHEPFGAFTIRGFHSQPVPHYQNPYECGGLKLSISTPHTSITSMDSTSSTAIEGALSSNSSNPAMSLFDPALNSQPLTSIAPEPRRYLTPWEQSYEDPRQPQDQLLKQFKDDSGSHGSFESLPSGSWDFDTYSAHGWEDYNSTPSLAESPTTTSSCPRTLLPDLRSWNELPEDPMASESGLNSPAPSYVLDSSSISRLGHQQSRPPQHMSCPWEKLKSSASNNGSDSFGIPSPTISHTSMQPSYPVMDDYSVDGTPEMPDSISASKEDLDDDPNSSEPYAKLIHRALMSVPERKMILRDIYEWFAQNTSKASDSASKGWQNSIRHNLSMNAAFQKREISSPGGSQTKRTNVWVLAPEAVSGGVKSTTRYRKQGSNKKSNKTSACAPQRVNSGRKGGLAAKKAARRRRDAQDLSRRPAAVEQAQDRCTSRLSHSPVTPLDFAPFQSMESAFYQYRSPSQSQANLDSSSFDYSNISGVAEAAPDDPLFYHEGDYNSHRPVSDFALYGTGDAEPNLDQFQSL